MRIDELAMHDEGWICWEDESFVLSKRPVKRKKKNRETLAHLYLGCVESVRQCHQLSFSQASICIRSFWIEEISQTRPKSLPRIIGEDGFLRMYALGYPCSAELFRRIWQRGVQPLEDKILHLEPIEIEWSEAGSVFNDVDATPPGFFPKFFRASRLKKDHELLKKVGEDLLQVSKIAEGEKRILLTLAILSHGAAYREIEGYEIEIPSFTEKGKMVPYVCHQYLIAEGLKTISLTPHQPGATPIYLCQGTEFWPSQPSVLGSILANFGEHGSATEAYAHSWRRIHHHLRTLGEPLLAGHSMGGALAIQIALYSHSLIKKAYAFNPPMPNERDYHFYCQLSQESKQKIQVIANLDDFAFWRIGSKVVGAVTVFLGVRRWKFYTVTVWDCLLLFPAFVKFIRNVHHAFPAHQKIAALYESWVSVRLTQEEIEKENQERTMRFDYLHFLPKLYDPTRTLLTKTRRFFKWKLQEKYLSNEIEIITLHEKDLMDTMTEETKEDVLRELQLLANQKKALLHQLTKPSRSRRRTL